MPIKSVVFGPSGFAPSAMIVGDDQIDVGGYANGPEDVQGFQMIGSAPVQDGAGNWVAQVTLSWLEPQYNWDGTVLNDLAGYEIGWKLSSSGVWTPAQRVDPLLTTAYLTGFPLGSSVDFRIRAFDSSGNTSPDWTVITNQAVQKDTVGPAAPSQPQVTSLFGGIRAAWNGLDVNGLPMAADFSRITVHQSTVDGFTPDASNQVDVIGDRNGGTSIIVATDYGVPHYIKFVAYDRSGNPSAATSPQSPAVASRKGVSADFESVSVTNLVAGLLSADVGIAGRLLIGTLDANGQLVNPTGQRLVIDSSGISTFDDANQQTAYLGADGTASFQSNISSGATIRASDIIGSTIETTNGLLVINDEGLTMIDSTGATKVSFSTDSGSVFLHGQVQADTLNVGLPAYSHVAFTAAAPAAPAMPADVSSFASDIYTTWTSAGVDPNRTVKVAVTSATVPPTGQLTMQIFSDSSQAAKVYNSETVGVWQTSRYDTIMGDEGQELHIIAAARVQGTWPTSNKFYALVLVKPYTMDNHQTTTNLKTGAHTTTVIPNAANGEPVVRLAKNVNGVWTFIDTKPYMYQVDYGIMAGIPQYSSPVISNDWPMQYRFKVAGASVYAKIWDYGSPEPASWTTTAVDATINTPGSVGFGLWHSNIPNYASCTSTWQQSGHIFGVTSLDAALNVGTDGALWIGAIDMATSPFSVSATGFLVATSAFLYGDITLGSTGRIRVNTTADASLTSTGHGFQIGLDTGANVRIDNNEIMAVNNGAASTLYLNMAGGDVTIGNSASNVTINGHIAGAPNFLAAPTRNMVKAVGTVDGYLLGSIATSVSKADFVSGTANVSGTSGQITVNHNLGATPNCAFLQSRDTSAYMVIVASKSASNVVFQLRGAANGIPASGTNISYDASFWA